MFDNIVNKFTKTAKKALKKEAKKGMVNGVGIVLKIASFAVVTSMYIAQGNPLKAVKKAKETPLVIYNYYAGGLK